MNGKYETAANEDMASISIMCLIKYYLCKTLNP